MKTTFLFAVACLTSLSASGCAYARARALDAADVFGIRLSAGIGLRANLRATHFAQAGLGVMLPLPHGMGFGGMKLGFLGRNLARAFESSVEIGLAPFFPWRFTSDEGSPRSYHGERGILLGRTSIGGDTSWLPSPRPFEAS